MGTTKDIYSHVMPALAREAADRMGTLLLTGQAGPTATRIANTDAADGGQDTAGRTRKALFTRVELRGLEPLTPHCQCPFSPPGGVRPTSIKTPTSGLSFAFGLP